MKTRLDPQDLSLDAAPSLGPRTGHRVSAGEGPIPRTLRVAMPRPDSYQRLSAEISPDPRARLLVRSRDDSNLAGPLAASAITHGLIAALMFLRAAPHLQEATPPAEVAVIWQPNPNQKLSLPNPGSIKNAPPAEARQSVRSSALPTPPPSQQAAPTPPAPSAPEQEATQAPEQKSTNEEQAQATHKATPSPRRETRRAAPVQDNSNPFASMTNLNVAVPSSVNSLLPSEHSADVPGPAPPGHASLGSSVDSLDAPNSSPDWQAEMRAWVEARDYYPEAAIVKHEEGISTVEITIDQEGKVIGLELTGQSGSDRLDDAWLSVFRGRIVPKPTPDMDASNGYTFRATLQYVLIEQ